MTGMPASAALRSGSTSWVTSVGAIRIASGLRAITASSTGTWSTGLAWLSSGTWYARATQSDAAGNVSTSDVFGPYSN